MFPQWECGGNAMGSSREPDALPMLESSCPEFYATDIGRIEPAGGDNVRIYMCVRRGKVLEPIFTVVMPIGAMSVSARIAMHAAAEAHNYRVLSEISEDVAH
jgi:hypothetical protein